MYATPAFITEALHLVTRVQPLKPLSQWKCCGQDLKKAIMKKMWNQKQVDKACVGMLLITLKILIMMTQTTKHFTCLNVLWPEKNVLQPGSSLSKFLMWSITFLHRPWLPSFDFSSFSSQPFLGLGHNFFIATVFLLEICNYHLHILIVTFLDKISYAYTNYHIWNVVIVDIFTVPTPTVSVKTLNNQTVGQSLTLQCGVTTVRGITSRVDIVWRSDGTQLERINDVTSTTMNNSLVYTNYYTISQLSTTDENRVIQCEVVISTSPLVMASDNITLVVTGKYWWCCIYVTTY